MLQRVLDLGLVPVPLPGTANSFVVPGFLQALGYDPAELERHMLDGVRTVGRDEDLALQPDHPVHVMGSHVALGYRGNEINRSKQWYEHDVAEGTTLRYYYTGHQWRICAAQRSSKTRPRLAALIDQMNKALGQKTNHVIFTLYRDGKDSIGLHHDKVRSISQEATDYILVVKLGENARRFSIYDPVSQQMLWNEPVEPGSLVVMSPADNQLVKHGVPEELGAGQSSSFVMRNITEKLSTQEVEKNIRRSDRARDERRAKKMRKEEEKL